jgi:hypothetical protein
MTGRALSVSTMLMAWSVPLSAQLIAIRTVPVSQAHQFDFFPSNTASMGGISIAAEDSLLDPMSNPATGTRIGAPRLFSSPGVYSVSSHAGAGRSLPLGAFTKTGAWFGGASFVVQEVDMSNRGIPLVTPFSCPDCFTEDLDLGPTEESRGNTYAFGLLGRELDAGWSVGASVFWSDLNALDGVDLLYAGAARIRQAGYGLDMRLGVLKEWSDERTLEAVLLHNRFGMTHDVFYLDTFWNPGAQQFAQRPRMEENLDRTSVWGLHLQYEHPLTVSGWRLGWLATANRMSHPKIPNYEIMNIPRDPGYSTAFNAGIGIARMDGDVPKFGIDFIYEPIWSHTWADSDVPITTSTGSVIPVGGKTIENNFRFSNSVFRMGVGEEVAMSDVGHAMGFQLGLAVRNNHYWLRQRDNVQLTSRKQEERWTEWTPTWGLGFRFPKLEIAYRGSVTNGTGRPGVVPDNGIFEVATPNAVGSNILVAPSGPLTLGEVKVVTHQVSFSLPLH